MTTTRYYVGDLDLYNRPTFTQAAMDRIARTLRLAGEVSPAFTALPGWGYWLGAVERCVIISISQPPADVTAEHGKPRDIALALAEEFSQDAVLLEHGDGRSELVWSDPSLPECLPE